MSLKQWMVLQGNAQDPHLRVIQDLPQLYIQIDPRMIVLHEELYAKLGSALHHPLFVSNVTNKAIMLSCVMLKFSIPQVHCIPIEIQGDLGTAEVEVVEVVDPNVLYMRLRQLILQNHCRMIEDTVEGQNL